MTTPTCTLRELALYFLKLGTVGFGGPIALAGYMQRDLVETRGWFTKEDYLDGLALSQLAPGPLAAQLAMYLGWARGGVVGATICGVAFVLPSFLMVLALSWLYVSFGGLSWMQAAFYGIGAAVVAIIARSAWKLARMTLAKDALLWGIAIVNGVVTAWTESEIVALFLASGVLALMIRGRPTTTTTASFVPPLFLSGIAGPASGKTLWTITWFFAKAGAFVFGSGLAIVPFLYGGVVKEQGWLNDQQFLDAVAVAMITPGPVVITVAFIGWLVAGPIGATLAAFGTFFPCWLFVVVPAPFFKKYSQNTRVKAFVSGVTSAATGAIAGAAFVLARRAVVDIPALVLCLVTLAVIFKAKKAPEPLVILVAGALGAAWKVFSG
jgi:chromate transporter